MKYLLAFFFAIILFTSITFSQWIPQNSNSNQRLLTTFFLNENLGWAGGNEGCILKTTNGGINWNYYSIGTKYTVHAIHFVDSLNGWAALYTFTPNRAGYIAATNDGGINWYFQYYIEGVTLHNVYFYDQYFGWAVGSSGIFLRTVNGGATWQEDFLSMDWSWSVEFVNPNLGWVGVGFAGYIRKTTDGGYSWQYKSVPSYSRMNDIDFINENIGWAVGQYGHIIKTTNGGEIWIHQNSMVSQELNDVEFVNENEGWVVGLGGIILHTTNGGTNWFLQGSNTSSDLFGVSFCNQDVGWIAGDQGLILNTENGGGPPIPVELVSFSANFNNGVVNLSWVTATELNNSGFEVERKSENGDWNKIAFVQGNGTTTETKHYFYLDDIQNINNPKLHYRLKQIDFDGSFEYSKEIEININLPSIFRLGQNYPNPFNPNTTINYELPIKSSVTLKIVDILGNEVETLVNEEKNAGYYQISFDGSNISSGIYFYTLQTENYFVTKKMILLK